MAYHRSRYYEILLFYICQLMMAFSLQAFLGKTNQRRDLFVVKLQDLLHPLTSMWRTYISSYTQYTFYSCGFQKSLQHAAGASVLETLVRGQRILGPVASMTELTNVQGVGLLVLVLEVSLQRVVAAEGATAVGTLLGFVDATAGWGRHSDRAL